MFALMGATIWAKWAPVKFCLVPILINRPKSNNSKEKITHFNIITVCGRAGSLYTGDLDYQCYLKIIFVCRNK